MVVFFDCILYYIMVLLFREGFMHTFNIRNIDDSIYDAIKSESRQKGISINKLILNILKKIFSKTKQAEFHDLDRFFGIWTEEEYNNVTKAIAESRKIDEELWQ